MQHVRLPNGTEVPALGQGTWNMGEGQRPRAEEIAALRLGLDLGLTLIDTAEMYGDGQSEALVGEAIAGRREQVFLVSKVYPRNATRSGVPAACERSLKRLATDRIDLYLLHWRGPTPLAETVAAFERLREQGKIRHWGVSNLDTPEMEELLGVPEGTHCAADQVLYNPQARGIEFDLLPWCERRGMPVMAYSPIGQGGRLLGERTLRAVAARHEATPAQVVLAWALRRPGVIAIPKSGNAAHVRQNAAAAALRLGAEDLAELDRALPPPGRKQRLAML
jgi:diketogulonate reductase-like aldo/keto reductase